MLPLGTIRAFISSRSLEENWQIVLEKWGITHKGYRRLKKVDKKRFINQVNELEGYYKPTNVGD